jgi:RND family efflux transporter MFP subunit
MLKYMTLITVSALSLGLAGCKEETQEVSEARPVRAISVTSADIQEERMSIGDIQPRRESEMGFRVSGKVIERTANVGAAVKAGDIIARIDDEDYRNRLKQAAADVKAAEAVFEEAKANEGRQSKLLKAGVTTRVNYDAAKKGLLSAEATLQSARVALKMAGDQLAHTELKAEFDGVVTATGAEAGQVVNTGQMIARVAPIDERDAVFAIAESAIQEGHYRVGAEVGVALLSDTNIRARGKVREVSPMADPATRTFEVKVALENPPSQMLFGASVAGEVKAGDEKGFALPPAAIFDGTGKPSVWVYRKDNGSVTLRPIAVARYEEDRVIVSEGLAKGDVVVTAGVNRLREGQEVTLAEEGSL